MNPCAVCGDETDAPEYWNRHVCRDCRNLRVLFAARCERMDCFWSTTEAGFEASRGAVKQAIQREANFHETTERVIRKNHGHSTEHWEMDHPDRERLLPSEGGGDSER